MTKNKKQNREQKKEKKTTKQTVELNRTFRVAGMA
jgi:hypothetical protein